MSTRRDLEIKFADGTAGTAVATWGQHAIWDVVRTLGTEAPRYNVSVSSPVTPAMPVSHILDSIQPLIGIHESLRTRLRPDDDGGLRQIVDAAGQVPVVVRECAADDAAAESAALHAEVAGRPFDFAREWPIRVGLVEADGLVRHIALSVSHTAVDGWGMRQLALNMAAISLGEPVDQLRERLPSMQPRAEAEFQASDRGRRLDANARQYWIKKLALGPAQLFPTRGAENLPWPHGVLNSPALATAAANVAAHHRVSASSVLLAAASTMVSRVSGSPDAVFQIVVNNRFLPGLTNAVSTLAQEGLFHFSAVDKDFPDAIRRTHRITLNTYRNSYYDKRRLDADIERANGDGGTVTDHSCFFNDVRNLIPMATDGGAPREPLAKALSRTTWQWRHDCEPRPNVTFAVDVLDAPGALELVMVADGGRIPRPDMERFLSGIEDLVVGEARSLGYES
ncbi:MAG TPA: condensation domain-containing protein [Pseudonocardiaceae bacterium]|nr:condensation domain-containing protein [Pseudonocardiaceae bacterium]